MDVLLKTQMLSNAAFFHQAERCRALIAEGADVNARGAAGETPLHACWDRWITEHVSEAALVATLTVLLDSGADPDIRNANSYRPLDIVCMRGMPLRECELLLRAGSDVNGRDDGGRTALHRCWRVDVCRELIRWNADVNAVADDGNTPLHDAAEWNNRGVCQTLVDAGAQLEVENGRAKTALDLAANAGVAEVLIKAGADACRGDMKWRNLARRCRVPLVELFARRTMPLPRGHGISTASFEALGDDVLRTIGRMALDDHR